MSADYLDVIGEHSLSLQKKYTAFSLQKAVGWGRKSCIIFIIFLVTKSLICFTELLTDFAVN